MSFAIATWASRVSSDAQRADVATWLRGKLSDIALPPNWLPVAGP